MQHIATSSQKRFYPLLVILIVHSIFLCNTTILAQHVKGIDNEDYKKDVLEKVEKLSESKYVLPDKASIYAEEFRRLHESGHYSSIKTLKEFADQVSSDLVAITKDKHISFREIKSTTGADTPESSLRHPIRYHLLGIKENKGFSKIEWKDGNIGYLDLRRFYTYADVKDLVTALMKLLSNANAIIIDIRENGGGSGDYLSSYFLEHPTQLTGWYSREDQYLTEQWTSDYIGIEPLTDIPLFLITSDRTFSAAESFAYDMKVRERAVIIGDSTKGGAHSVDLYNIDSQFEIYIPTVRAINPITGTNWEGSGVIPDIVVPAVNAFDTTLALAKKSASQYATKKAEELNMQVKQLQIYMDNAEKYYSNNDLEDGKIALDLFFDHAGKYHLVNEFFVDVLAYHYLSPRNEKILFAILEKKIELYPNSPSAFESLAFAYYKNNKKEPAIEYFKKVIELDPGNRNAKNMIALLRK